MSKFVLLFRSTRDTIKAEKLCVLHTINCAPIPVPRHVSSECGIALEVDEVVVDRITALLQEEKIDIVQIASAQG
jgi:hypothetical protein